MYENTNLPEHVTQAHELAAKVFSQYLPEQQVEFIKEFHNQLKFHQKAAIMELSKELEDKSKIWGV